MQCPIHNQELKPKANPKTKKQKTVVCSTTVCLDFDSSIYTCLKIIHYFSVTLLKIYHMNHLIVF